MGLVGWRVQFRWRILFKITEIFFWKSYFYQKLYIDCFFGIDFYSIVPSLHYQSISLWFEKLNTGVMSNLKRCLGLYTELQVSKTLFWNWRRNARQNKFTNKGEEGFNYHHPTYSHYPQPRYPPSPLPQ